VSYRNAERAAADETERASIERRRREYEQSKLDLVAAQKKKEEEEKQRELQKLKDEALARVRAADSKANAQLQANATQSNAAPVAWSDLNPSGKVPDGKFEGKLERVDCVGKETRISVRAGRSLMRLNAEPSKLVLAGAGEMTLVCGVQKKPRDVAIEYFTRADAKAGTAGDAVRIDFRN
jgi:hypothetical protein